MANNPKITNLGNLTGRPNQPDAVFIVWPDAPSATKGPGLPSAVPGQTDAPNPRRPNVAKGK
jgi:hypothetical protein